LDAVKQMLRPRKICLYYVGETEVNAYFVHPADEAEQFLDLPLRRFFAATTRQLSIDVLVDQAH